jgi:hypothetical protein
LGLLDRLDDFGTLHSSEPQRLHLVSEAQHSHGVSDAEAPTAPLPRDGADASHWDGQHGQGGVPVSPASELDQEFSTRDKLELLRSLMDDVRVREALGALTGSNG